MNNMDRPKNNKTGIFEPKDFSQNEGFCFTVEGATLGEQQTIMFEEQHIAKKLAEA